MVNDFKDMASQKMQKRLVDTNTIIVPHRALTAYLGYETIENKFKVPIFGLIVGFVPLRAVRVRKYKQRPKDLGKVPF